MTAFLPYTHNQLESALQLVGAAAYTTLSELKIAAWRTSEPVPFDQRMNGEPLSLKIGDSWGKLFDCAWFRFSGLVPAAAAGKSVVLLLDINGEMLVVNADGTSLRGLTNVASVYDYSLGLPGKRVLPLLDRAQGGESVEVWADAGMNDLFGNVQENGQIKEAFIAVLNPETLGLYYDMEVLLDSLKVIPEASPRHQQIRVALNDVVHAIWNGVNEENAALARKILANVLHKEGGDPSLRISAVGHAHMDLAWLWPLRETRRKGARTFATALQNLDQYPDYIFAASQPQLFQWMKEGYPELYQRIKQKVKDGRIEPQGALWVECDTNLTSGESLVRQVLYGQKFFLEEFGVEPSYIWLPDTFGYSAALPQIIRKAGLKYFSTQKLSWSLINHFPHHSFFWQGIDGTAVMVHMLPEETYNSPALPRAIAKIESNYAEKGISESALMVFGIGDGGGGPGEEHLERLLRLKNFAGLSPVKQEWTRDFFTHWEKDAARFPTWVGELYLERHEGTLTSNSRSKWYNRRMEQALRELEWLAAMAKVQGLPVHVTEGLEEIWKEVLLYQFHDILPGSSIKRVYDESLERYQVLLKEVEGRIQTTLAQLAGSVDSTGTQQPQVIFNSLNWERKTWAKAGSDWQQVTVPASGYVLVDAGAQRPVPDCPKAAADHLENDRLRITFDPSGAISSIFDKQANREVLPPGENANRLVAFVDRGDAWDFAMDYADTQPSILQLVSAQASQIGPTAVITQVYRLGHSQMSLEISLETGSPRIDFSARLQWRTPQTMLRALFPVNVSAEQATFEIQFGHVTRTTHTNTTWDLARDEVPAQKWVDLSQRDYGVALINDSKYGHRIKGHTIELDLLRSVPYTGPVLVSDSSVQPGEPHDGYSDQADMVFRYALLPHTGDFVAGDVIHSAYEFNIPLRTVETGSHPGQLPSSQAWIEIGSPSLILETIKQAEDSSGMLLRLYEASRASVHTTLKFNFPVQKIEEADLLERPLRELKIEGNAVALSFSPFEIKTLLVK